MKKNLLVLGALTVTLALGACMDGQKKGEVSSKDLENASSVETYYKNTLVLLQRMVEEKDVNAVLNYMDMGQKAPAIPDYTPLVIAPRDSAEAVNPGDYFNKESRVNLSKNFSSLFSARRLFYDNFNNYMDLMRINKAAEAKKYMDANYKLSIEIAEFKQNIFDILSPAVAEAQNVLLNDNPMKDQMIAIQKMKNTILSIVDLYGSSRVMDKARLDLKITELNLQLDAAENLPEVQGQPKENQDFKAYLEKVETFVNLMQKIRHKDTYSDEDYDALYGYGLSII